MIYYIQKIIQMRYYMDGQITLTECSSQIMGELYGITDEQYRGKLKEFNESTVKGILQNGSLVGWMHIYIPQESLYSGFLFIYIAPEYRRRGIASAVYRMAEEQFAKVGCNWWSSYPESDVADAFAVEVGFSYTNTNSYMVFGGTAPTADFAGIRRCTPEDYPVAPDIWSKEYAEMHKRLGLPVERRTLSEKEREEEHSDFIQNINNYFVIEENGNIVGVGTLFDDNSGIGSLAVDSAYGGKGYGFRLACFLTHECIRRGNNKPCLYCESGNDNALHIYKKLGYIEESRESVAFKDV